MDNVRGENPPGGGAVTLAEAPLVWARRHWPWLVGAVVLLLIVWRASSGTRDENGRYVLVKDDVPCQSVRSDDDGRRWCYVVLDSRTGKLEERVRKIGGRRK